MNRVEIKAQDLVGAKATLVIDGHTIRTASSVVLEVDANGIILATVKFPLHDGVDADVQARVHLDEPTREALIGMGWAPPPENCMNVRRFTGDDEHVATA